MDKHIITECYIDTMVVENALSVTNGCNHQKGCNNVSRIMQAKLQDMFAIGIIDDDKCKHSYFNEFRQIAVSDNAAVKLYKHKERNHYFIIICPAMERFILDAAKQCNVSPSTCNLPGELGEFLKITKSETSKDNENLRKLISVLKQQGAESICQLEQWLGELTTNPCNPSIDLLHNK
ncbi:MAG: hypothetical protein LBD52_08680 [Prevotellaceae bacterium]|jgi:hypothetical protein|nr:hypothetical protein [Prevotellaceae bacterium]